ncbi:Oidioi.mRNA.OKI2018_I69.XSR.g16137.t2.cds [Oikopleura dioica]|uniref:Oidioi.mRNA.OKI2018_I69.XSR.g16137.t2.cds n=1 Tax=Oikopleura dioica TaxID=34765 RepID=A0ABN7SJD6_OIKDI|nr:Oidioi.mRNA.OKI2018_I69.XSR.g16137.t2.cds [Oikopleura dioica]
MSGRRPRRPDAEDDSLTSIAREAEARLEAKRAARKEAREIRLKELDKQQREGKRWNDRSMRYSMPNLSSSSRSGSSLSLYKSQSRLNSRNGSEVDSLYRCDSRNSLFSDMDDLESQSGDYLLNSYQEGNGSLPKRFADTNDYSTSNGSNGRPRVEISAEDRVRRLENTYFNELKELKAMVQNAQLDNEKTAWHYENEHLKNLLEEREDTLATTLKELNEKCQLAQRLKTQTEAQNLKLDQLREIIRQKDQIIQDKSSKSESQEQLRELRETLIWRDNKIKALEVQRDYFQNLAQSQISLVAKKDGGYVPENDDSTELELLRNENEQLKQQLLAQNSKSSSSASEEEIQVKERLYQEAKARANKAEQEIEAQKQYTVRLEGQVSRYKAAADHYESSEDDLKAEKRRLQRELRTWQDKAEELELTNEHLEKRLEKIRQARMKT